MRFIVRLRLWMSLLGMLLAVAVVAPDVARASEAPPAHVVPSGVSSASAESRVATRVAGPPLEGAQLSTYLAGRHLYRAGMVGTAVGVTISLSGVALLATVGCGLGGCPGGLLMLGGGAIDLTSAVVMVVGGGMARGALVRAGHQLSPYPQLLIAAGVLLPWATVVVHSAVPLVVGVSALVTGIVCLGVTNGHAYRRSVPRLSLAPRFDPRERSAGLAVAGRF